MAPSFFTPQCIRPGKGPTSFVPQAFANAVRVVGVGGQCCEGGGGGEDGVRVVMRGDSAVQVVGVGRQCCEGGEDGDGVSIVKR